MKHSPTHLSDCLIHARNAYTNLELILETVNEIGVTDDIRARLQDMLDDLGFYLNQILEHSSPEDWTDEEYEWIEGVRADLAGSA